MVVADAHFAVTANYHYDDDDRYYYCVGRFFQHEQCFIFNY